MTSAYVVGYDPGGNRKHGLALLRVEEEAGRWKPAALESTLAPCLADAVAWVEGRCGARRIVAAGVDTLTEWSSGLSGWRAADLWLRREYPEVTGSIIAPAALRGGMVVSGAGFLLLLADRFNADRTAVTEAHPKVAYFALTRRRDAWEHEREGMAAWLAAELTVALPGGFGDGEDHVFDAAVGALAALRGLNGDWTRDLHALPHGDAVPVRFCGATHYWWPPTDPHTA